MSRILGIDQRYGPGATYTQDADWLPLENPTFAVSTTITIDHTLCGSSSSTGFPFLFSGTFTALATVANGGSVQSSSGYDIAFFNDANHTQWLTWELEYYDPLTGTIRAWIKVPTLSSTVDTVIYVAYGSTQLTTFVGNAPDVWTNNLAGVWHLGDGTTLSAGDSTRHSAAATISGATATTGQIDGGAGFASASTQYIEGANIPAISGVSAVTFSGWFKRTGASDNVAFGQMAPRDGSSIGFSGLYLYSDGKAYFELSGSSIFVFGGVALTGTGLHHLVGVFDGSLSTDANRLKLYVDSALQVLSFAGSSAVPATTPTTNTGFFDFGRYVASGPNPFEYSNGVLDEARATVAARSADWVTAEYNNQSNPATFSTSIFPAAVTLGSIALTVAPQPVAATGASATTLGAIAIAVAPQTATATGAGAQTLSTVTLTLALQAVTPTGLAAVTTGTVALTVAPQTISPAGAAATTLAAQSLTTSLSAPTVTGSANAALSAVALAASPQTVAPTGVAATTLLSVGLTLATPDTVATGAGATTLTAIPLTLAVPSVTTSAGGNVNVTLDVIAITADLQVVVPTGIASTDLTAITLAVSPQSVTTTGAGANTLSSLGLNLALVAVNPTTAVAIDLAAISLTTSPQSVTPTGAGALTLSALSFAVALPTVTATGSASANVTLGVVSLTIAMPAVTTSAGGTANVTLGVINLTLSLRPVLAGATGISGGLSLTETVYGGLTSLSFVVGSQAMHEAIYGSFTLTPEAAGAETSSETVSGGLVALPV